MRAGVVVEVAAGAADVAAAVAAIERLGLHLVWFRQGPRMPAPFVQAAAAAVTTTALRVGVEVEVGDVHPVYVAEEAAVADVATGGRLVLGLRPAAGADGGFGEAVALVRASHASRPFRHPGPRWPTPAGLDANTFNLEERVRVTPAPVQLDLPTWVVAAPAVAAAHGLSLLAPDLGAGAAHWTGRTAPTTPRPVEVDLSGVVDGRVDHGRIVEELHAAQRAWGCDLVLLTLPRGDAWSVALDRVARRVLPRLQLDRLPSGLTEHWEQRHA